MGDAPRPGEIHRITIEIVGPIDEKKFEAYKKDLRAMLAKVAGTKTRIRQISLDAPEE